MYHMSASQKAMGLAMEGRSHPGATQNGGRGGEGWLRRRACVPCGDEGSARGGHTGPGSRGLVPAALPRTSRHRAGSDRGLPAVITQAYLPTLVCLCVYVCMCGLPSETA